MSPSVTLLGRTHLEPEALDVLARSSPEVTDCDHLPEIAGRRCYRSEHRPNPLTDTNEKYLANIVRVGHFSVLAHSHAAFLIGDVSRSLTHELIRSVFLAYSQESQRYVVPPLDVEPVIPVDADDQDADELREAFATAIARYRTVHQGALDRGLKPKRAAGLARAFLPEATPTSLVVSGNMRAWRDFLAQRATPHAEGEIRTLAYRLLEQLVGIAPATFADIAASVDVPQRYYLGAGAAS